MEEIYNKNKTTVKLTENEIKRMLNGEILHGYKVTVGMEVKI